jgi:hypothetical protein
MRHIYIYYCIHCRYFILRQCSQVKFYQSKKNIMENYNDMESGMQFASILASNMGVAWRRKYAYILRDAVSYALNQYWLSCCTVINQTTNNCRLECLKMVCRDTITTYRPLHFQYRQWYGSSFWTAQLNCYCYIFFVHRRTWINNTGHLSATLCILLSSHL